MATLEQIAEGIRRADAAGDTEAVKKLGAAYLQMKGGAEPGMASGPEFDAALAAMQNVPGRLKGPEPMKPDLMGATAATLSGIVNSIPVLGPLSQGIVDNIGGHISQAMGGEFDAPVKRREAINAANPIANVAGNLGGAIGSFGALGATKLGAEAMGMGAGKYVPNLLKAGASNQALYTADQYARGESGLDTLGGGLPALLGMGGKVAGDVVAGAGAKVADAITKGAQRKLTDTAIRGAPSAGDLKTAASSLFEASTGGKPLMLSDTAYFRFLAGVKQVADKFRINAQNDAQSVGLLETLMRIADDMSNGVRVDLKDLHLVRQLAGKVAGSSQGRDSAFGASVIEQMDNFIKSLKPGDVLGGANPTQAANDLLLGISTWARASKVGTIEEAITKARTYKSGFENGLRLQFQALLRNPEMRRMFSGPEIDAIKDVANGTTGSNLVTLLGKFGFGTDGAVNMTGGTIGATLGGTLGSVFGPVGTAAGVAAAGLGGAGMRKLSERLGSDAANRAAQVVATPNIPIAPQARNLLEPARRPIDIMIRGGGMPALPNR